MKKLIVLLVVVISLMPFGLFVAFGDDFYTETLGRAAIDIQSARNAGDCRRIESYLREAEQRCVKDPKCDRQTLDMLNKSIDAVQKMYR